MISIHRKTDAAMQQPKVRGVHLGTVVDNKDGDGNPGYRVKVKISTLSDSESTFFARIAVPMGGKERGTYTLPEVDDQLLIVFEHGDIHKPIVIGSVWSKKQAPVEANESGKNNTKLIKSRSGHRIIFDDKEGAEKVTIVDKSKKNKIVFDSVNKVVKIESDGDIEIKAKQNVIIHGQALKIGAKAEIKGQGQQMLAHAGATFGVKASGTITVGGSQITMNCGGMSPACNVSGAGAGELGGGTETAQHDNEASRSSGASDGSAGAEGVAARAAGRASGSSNQSGGAASDARKKEAADESSPQPVLVSAVWSKNRAALSESVTLSAIAVDMAGKSATFTIFDADEPETVVATLQGTCDAGGVQAMWTTPTSAPPGRFEFTVSCDGQEARSGLLLLVRDFTVKLVLGDEPAAGYDVRLHVSPSGEERTATADDDGLVEFAGAPFGDVTLFLEDS